MQFSNNIKKTIYKIKVSLLSVYLRLSILIKKEKTIFIVATHGCLHLLQICLHFIPEHIQVIIIANGLTKQERRWLSSKLSVSKVVNIPRSLTHGTILDLLIFAVKDSFCTMDYDCFLLNETMWDSMFSIGEKYQCNVFFSDFNPELNLDVPHTCLLTLNTRIYRQLIKQFKIGCNQIKNYDLLPSKVKLKLKEVGVDKNHLPEKRKDILDTLKALQMIGIAEHYPIDYKGHLSNTWIKGQAIFHVGGTSYWQYPIIVETQRGGYFWYRALQLHPNDYLRNYYKSEFSVITTEKFLQRIAKTKENLEEEFINYCDEIINEGFS